MIDEVVLFIQDSQIAGRNFPVHSLFTERTKGAQIVRNPLQLRGCGKHTRPRTWKFPEFFPVNRGEGFARDCAHLDRRRFNRYLFADCANRKGHNRKRGYRKRAP